MYREDSACAVCREDSVCAVCREDGACAVCQEDSAAFCLHVLQESVLQRKGSPEISTSTA